MVSNELITYLDLGLATQLPNVNRSENVLMGLEGIRRATELGWQGISIEFLQKFIPENFYWKHEEYVCDVENPHSKAHNIRVALGFAILTSLEVENPRNELHIGLTVLKYHDIRQGRYRNNTNHGLEAAQIFLEEHQKIDSFKENELNDIEFLISHHSDRNEPEWTEKTNHLRQIFHRIQDADASDLRRYPLLFPYDTIQLHTQTAKHIRLPDIMSILQKTALQFSSGDSVKDQWEAASMLGLLVYES